MSEQDFERDPLEELAAEFTERCRRGEQPSVEDYAATYPDMADDIHELFSMIRDVEQAKHAGIDWSGRNALHAAPSIERLGDFRIIRELGRGGMGVVYEAEQESLGRHVAIKVLPHQYVASATRRERFEREARTAAKLHHTNIVPIFGVGEQEGYPYFVMQYIRGVGLDRVFHKLFADSVNLSKGTTHSSAVGTGAFDFGTIARSLLSKPTESWDTVAKATTLHLSTATADDEVVAVPDSWQRPLTPLYWRSLAGLMVQAADALAYAHSQGVLHRDIKPSNLLLDADGTVWVTDFGLAKAMEHEDMTQAGDIVGTLRYMAPEQYARQGEPRSDVYGLGVTLYELSVLRPAFVDSKGSSAVCAALEEPLFPPRRLCPSMPLDLETIILKATDRETKLRYASAAEFRDDLRRFVEDRPIHARRVSIPERMWRWSRRNPALAATTGLAIALLLAVAIISTSAYVHVRRANQRTQTALTGETQQRQRAEATADLSIEVLDTIFDEFAPQSAVVSGELSLTDSGGTSLSVSVPSVLSDETAKLLNHMLPFYQRLAEHTAQSHPLQIKVAAAHRRIGEIYERLSQYDDAKAAFNESIRHYEQLQATTSDSEGLRLIITKIHNQLGQVYFAEDQMRGATAQFDQARGLLSQFTEKSRHSSEVRFELARTCYLMGRPAGADLPIRHELFGRPGDGPPPRDGRGPRREILPGPPGGRPPRDNALAPRPPDLPSPPGFSPAQQQKYLNDAVEILKELVKAAPRAAAYRHLLAKCLAEFPPGLPPSGGAAEDSSALDQAIILLENLVADYPDAVQYRFDLCTAYGMSPPESNSFQRMNKALEIMQTLTRERPNVPSYSFALAQLYLRYAQLDREEGFPDDAVANLREAIRIQDALTTKFPKIVPYSFAAAFYESDLAEMLDRGEEFEEARTVLEKAIHRLETLPSEEKIKPHVRHLMVQCYEHLGDVLDALGAEQESRQARAKAQLYKQRPASPTQPESGPGA